MLKAKSKTKKKKRKKLTPDQKLQRRVQQAYYKNFRNLFKDMGFSRIKADGIEINFKGRTGELDDIFLYENVLVIVEYTVGRPESEHILKKKPLYEHILNNSSEFVEFAFEAYSGLSDAINGSYDPDDIKIRIIYAPLREASSEVVDLCPAIKFLQGSLQKYFFALAKTIQKSARIEFLTYLGLGWEDVGEANLKASQQHHNYAGQLLPEGMSSFPPGYKVVSFYADPESLIEGAYVLRRDGWAHSSHLYQRILVSKKLAKMRRYLLDEKRVFVNNIIVTLPAETVLNEPLHKGTNIPERDLNRARPISVAVPMGYGKIGIIDGQHRVFCYHEGTDVAEGRIAKLRIRQHLLVTGIIYPKNMGDKARLEFEAKLFLEINDTQTRARSALRQDIETLVRPFSGIAVARRVIAELGKRGPYKGLFQLSHFDSSTKIKTSSIVSYGLRPLVKFEGDDSLFSAWRNAEKTHLSDREDRPKKGTEYDDDLDLLEKYIDFCVDCLNGFFVAVKLARKDVGWDLEAENPSPLLRPTSINGLIACLRLVILNNGSLAQAAHEKRLHNIPNFNFDNYKSSHWNELGRALFEKHYKLPGS